MMRKGEGGKNLLEQNNVETLWLRNIRTVDKVQITDHSNIAPSSKTFRDELYNRCGPEMYPSFFGNWKTQKFD
jgi:hypothetical protein